MIPVIVRQGGSPEDDAPSWRGQPSSGAPGRSSSSPRAEAYEQHGGHAGADRGQRILTRHETVDTPTNLLGPGNFPPGRADTAVTDLARSGPHSSPAIPEGVRHVRERERGGLSATLYLPVDYREGGGGRAVVWAYPREFSNPEGWRADQRIPQPVHPPHWLVAASSNLTQGGTWSSMAGHEIPMGGRGRGPGQTTPTIEQLVVSSCKGPAVDKLDENWALRIASRIGVGGQSYGAFMTAEPAGPLGSLPGGVARSGA